MGGEIGRAVGHVTRTRDHRKRGAWVSLRKAPPLLLLLQPPPRIAPHLAFTFPRTERSRSALERRPGPPAFSWKKEGGLASGAGWRSGRTVGLGGREEEERPKRAGTEGERAAVGERRRWRRSRRRAGWPDGATSLHAVPQVHPGLFASEPTPLSDTPVPFAPTLLIRSCASTRPLLRLLRLPSTWRPYPHPPSSLKDPPPPWFLSPRRSLLDLTFFPGPLNHRKTQSIDDAIMSIRDGLKDRRTPSPPHHRPSRSQRRRVTSKLKPGEDVVSMNLERNLLH